eukprot:7409479-Alexandrium_andersonii.AAC.1
MGTVTYASPVVCPDQTDIGRCAPGCSVRVCVCVCVCMCARLRARACVPTRACSYACVRAGAALRPHFKDRQTNQHLD